LVTRKKILITAGPTWVAIDNVRVISNIATGWTGILLSKLLADKKADVTLLLGPAEATFSDKRVNIIRYRFFEELSVLLKNELKTGRFDAVIHSAAVSDYKPKKVYRKKVSSLLKSWGIKLIPTPKLIDQFSRAGNKILKVGFKFEPAINDKRLISEGKLLRKKSHLDLVVANSMGKNGYRAFITGEKTIGPFASKIVMAKKLCELLDKTL